MQDMSGWVVLPPGGNAPRTFPAIDAVRGPGGGAGVIQGRQDMEGMGLGLGLNREVFGGFGDEIGAAVGATGDYVRGLATGNRASWADLYENYLDIERTDQKEFREDRPISAIGANIAGGLTTGPGAILNAGTALGRIVVGMGTGAVVGGSQAFGEGEGGLGNRVESGVRGAAVGAAVGGALPAIGEAIGRVARGVAYVKGLKGDAARARAQKMIEEAMSADGVTMADLQRLQASGKPVTIADLGPNTRALVGASSRAGGEGRQIIEDFFEGRTRGQYNRIGQDVGRELRVDPNTFGESGEAIAARRASKASTGYPAAYAVQAPKLSENAQSLLATPDGKKAIATAKRFMGNRRAPVTDADGNYTVEMLDQIQRALRDTADRASGARGRELAGNVGNLRSQFLQELPDDLRKVMSDYANESSLLDALDAGRKFMRGDTEAVGKAIADMSGREQEMFRLGVARELMGKIGGKVDSADASGFFQNPNMRERLRKVFGSKRLFQEFMEKAQLERRMQETRNAVLKGSPTAGRLQDDQNFATGILGDAAGDVLTGGNVGASALRAVGNIATRGRDRLLDGLNQEVGTEIARRAAGQAVPPVTAPQLPAVQSSAATRALTGAPTPSASGAGVAAGGTPQGALDGWMVLPPEAAPAPPGPQSSLPPNVERITQASAQANRPVSPMTLARAFTGASESRDADVIGKFIERFGGSKIDPAQTAWCAAFVNAVLGASGGEGTGRLNARSFLEWGNPVDRPTPGDVAVFSRGDPNGWQGHVGFFAGYETKNGERHVRVIGGNQGDSVSEALYPESRLLGFRRPTKSA